MKRTARLPRPSAATLGKRTTINRVAEQLAAKLGRPASDEEVAKVLARSPAAIAKLRERAR